MKIKTTHQHDNAQANAVATTLHTELDLTPLADLVAALLIMLILLILPLIGQPPKILAIITPY